MPGTIIATTGSLHDQDTGKRTGYINPLTGNDEVDSLAVTPDEQQLLASLRGSFALASKDAFGRILTYSKNNVTYAINWSNAAARQPTSFSIVRVVDSVIVKAGSIDADGYPTVIA